MTEQRNLPPGWTRLAMGEVGRWIGGGTPSKGNPAFWTGGKIPWVSPKDMKSALIADAQDHITEEAVKQSATNLVEAGSVLIVVRSGILQHTFPVAVTQSRVALNQDLKAVTPGDTVRADYLALALKAFERDILRTCTKTGTTVQSLELPLFLRFEIPLAPVDQQRWIVAEIEKQFTRLDAGVAALRRTQTNLKRYRAAVLKAAYEGNLFPAERHAWSRFKISEVGKTVTGNTPPTSDNSNFGNEVPFFKPTDLDAGYNVREARQFLSAKGAKKARVLPAGAVLVTCIGATIGKTGFARVSCATNQQINALVVDSAIATSEWVFWALTSPEGQRQIKANASATTLPILNKSKFEALVIPVPSLAEQTRITTEVERRLSIVEQLEVVVGANLDRAVRFRTSLLSQAFEGRLLRGESSPISTRTDVQLRTERPAIANPVPPLQEVKTRNVRPVEKVSRKRAEKVGNQQLAFSSDMSLLRLKLFEDFNSLKAFDYIYRANEVTLSTVSPICLVGLNGSGKSNLIEALSEALCCAELSLLPWKSITKTHRDSKLRFILEYGLAPRQKADALRVRIEKTNAKSAIFYLTQNDLERRITDPSECLRILPTRVIGYSSGLNETISLPYFRTSALYSEEVRNRANAERERRNNLPPIENTRVLFADYDSNALILIANYLFQSRGQLDVFKRALRIENLASFDVRFRPSYHGNKAVQLTKELKNYVSCFRECADIRRNGVAGTEIFHFESNGDGFHHLRKFFKTAGSFFAAAYKLSLLNSLALRGRDRKFFTRQYAKSGQLDRAPTVAREDRIFSIENIKLRLHRPNKVIDYAAISDGEHQFLQVFGAITLFKETGSLFLLDEPETHFNPQWRRKFVQILNDISSAKRQEFIISTHSPFIVSGCHGRNVFLFERHGDSATCAKVGFETFGGSYDVLLSKLFALDTMIAGQAIEELKKAIKSDSLATLEAAASKFGDSFEKRFLFERIAEVKKRKNRKR